MKHYTFLLGTLIVFATPAAALPVCEGGDRAARGVTCIVDGDTGWEAGRKWRYASIDTPEMAAHAECHREAELAIVARDRLRELMARGYEIEWSGERGTYGRDLVTIRLADGRDAGYVLVEEGLAQEWPNNGNVWCE